jgi:hypothetical protein
MECDFNLHKSNSTYFADADVARTTHITALLRKGLNEAAEHDARKKKEAARLASQLPASINVSTGITLSPSLASSIPTSISLAPPSPTSHTGNSSLEVPYRPETLSRLNSNSPTYSPPCTSTVSGHYQVAIGAVSCHFKREIAPYEQYDIWTRVLSWDRKWIYLVSHFVKAGAVAPDSYTVQPWKNKTANAGKDAASRGRSEKRRDSGVDSVTDDNDLISEESDTRWQKAVFATSVARYVVKKGRLTVPPEDAFRRSDLLPSRDVAGQAGKADPAEWTWANVEAQRLRGLAYAEKLAGLEELHSAWPCEKGSVPGERRGENGRRKVDVIGSFADLW